MGNRIQNLIAAAERGSKKAQKECARVYWSGDQIPMDHGEAIKWYRKLADDGDPEHQMSLGLALVWSDEPFQDVIEGVRWITCAAEQGHIGAQYFLGSSYASGDEVEKDLGKAIRWYKIAAENGHGEAQYNLAIMLLTGEGIEKDFEAGLNWMGVSADAGESYSIEFLRDAYRNGSFGFQIDVEQSKYWAAKLRKLR